MFRHLHRFVGLLVLAASLVGGWYLWDFRVFTNSPLNVGPEGVVLEVKQGTSLRGLARELSERDLLATPTYFVFLGRIEKVASHLRAGEYQVPQGTTPKGLLDLLVSGNVIQHELTIVEGWTFRQLREALANHPALKQTFREASDEAIMTQLGEPGLHPEGQFAPDTYYFPRGTTDAEFLKRAHDTLELWLAQEWSVRDEKLPYDDSYEALIMASIIEKETGLASERGQIAGVFVRRLRKKMRLQTDPTVIYGMGDRYDGNIRKADLSLDTPYNTYTRGGLPPTPIALPSLASLKAALHPDSGSALYFVAKGDGSHHFSDTIEEHQAAVRRYQLKKN